VDQARVVIEGILGDVSQVKNDREKNTKAGMTYDCLTDLDRVLVISAEVVVWLLAAAGVDDHERPATKGRDRPLRSSGCRWGVHPGRARGWGWAGDPEEETMDRLGM
jgi:hypothetical protein